MLPNKNTIPRLFSRVFSVACITLIFAGCTEISASKQTGDFKGEYMHLVTAKSAKIDTASRVKPSCCKGAPSRRKALSATKAAPELKKAG